MTNFKRVLRRPEVENITGLSRSTIYEQMANGTFPKPVKIGKRAVGWLNSDLAAWLDSKIERSAHNDN
jgi:prophage regulatory protein